MEDLNEPEARVCAVCARVLDYVENHGYRHPMIGGKAGEDMRDHIAVPVLPKDVQVKGRCDFCAGDNPEFVLPVRSFGGLGAPYASQGDWAACAECAPLIEKDQWSALFRRYEAVRRYMMGEELDPRLAAAVKAMWRKVRSNTYGAIRPLE